MQLKEGIRGGMREIRGGFSDIGRSGLREIGSEVVGELEGFTVNLSFKKKFLIEVNKKSSRENHEVGLQTGLSIT